MNDYLVTNVVRDSLMELDERLRVAIGKDIGKYIDDLVAEEQFQRDLKVRVQRAVRRASEQLEVVLTARIVKNMASIVQTPDEQNGSEE